MGRRRHTPEQIITALREAEVGLASGKTAAMVSRELEPHSACGGRPPAPETISPSGAEAANSSNTFCTKAMFSSALSAFTLYRTITCFISYSAIVRDVRNV